MSRVRTLRTRFAFWTAGLLLAALIIFSLFIYANMSFTLSSGVDETLRLIGIQLMAELEFRSGRLIISEESTEDPQYARLREQGLSMRVLNDSGEIIQAHGPYVEQPVPAIENFSPTQTAEFNTYFDPATQESIRILSMPVVADERVVGVLQIVLSLNNVTSILNSLIVSLLLGVPFLVVAASVGGYVLASKALAPIDKIASTANQISGQDLSARLNFPRTDDEIGRLASTLDSMLARLEDAFRRERQFTADASHELRTPLAAIQTIISSTLVKRRDSEEYERALIDLRAEAERMHSFAEELLHLARRDAAQHPSTFEPVDLSLLLKDVIESLTPLAKDKGLNLCSEIPDDSLMMMGDSDALIRLFVNLIDNAIKYTEHGEIRLSAAAEDNFFLVKVNDTGIGIEPSHLPHIFNRFYRVDKSRSKKGMGLGLSIALSIARAHSGDITVSSKFGEGTTLIVKLSPGIVQDSSESNDKLIERVSS